MQMAVRPSSTESEAPQPAQNSGPKGQQVTSDSAEHHVLSQLQELLRFDDEDSESVSSSDGTRRCRHRRRRCHRYRFWFEQKG